MEQVRKHIKFLWRRQISVIRRSPDEELAAIWQSACRFAEKVQSQEGYVSPEDYNDEFCRESLKPADYSDIGQSQGVGKRVWGGTALYGSYRLHPLLRTVLIESSNRRSGPQRNFWICSLRTQRMTSAGQKQALLDVGVAEDDIISGGKALEKEKSAEARRRPIFPIYPHWHIRRL